MHGKAKQILIDQERKMRQKIGRLRYEADKLETSANELREQAKKLD